MMSYSKTGLFFTLALSASAVQAHVSPYWSDSYGNMVRDGYGQCVRTIEWKPELATAECGAKMKKAMTEKDSDNDGVVDSKDRCPSTPAGVKVNSGGCPTDADSDGVADYKDSCPGTASGARVDSKGCALDSDKDGVADYLDQCPGTVSGVEIDAKGCAVNNDVDGDGIANADDQCPNTAAGTPVNTQGCEIRQSLQLDNVQFSTGTDNISADSLRILDGVAKTLIDNPHLKFEVAGHTDSRGNYQYNVSLSQKRANSVRQYLMNKGVGADRLSAKGYGPDKPVASNDTREGRKMNRRVELLLK